MKYNQKGFSLVEAMLLIVIVAMIGFIGWYVWSSNKTAYSAKPAAYNPSIKKTDPNPEPAKNFPKISETIENYTVPKNWKLDNECGGTNDTTPESVWYLLPGAVVKCGSEGSGDNVSLVINDDVKTDPIKCLPEYEDSYKDEAWFVSYKCEEVTVDGKKGLKETVIQNDKAEFDGAGVYTTYKFALNSSQALTIAYNNPKSDTYDDTDVFNSFVNSLKFKS